VNSLNIGGRSETSNEGSGSGGFIRVLDLQPRADASVGASAQLLRQHQFGAAAFHDVVDVVEGAADQVQTEAAGLIKSCERPFIFSGGLWQP
jgi:hypothetical protein